MGRKRSRKRRRRRRRAKVRSQGGRMSLHFVWVWKPSFVV
jgi:hypothetical protein